MNFFGRREEDTFDPEKDEEYEDVIDLDADMSSDESSDDSSNENAKQNMKDSYMNKAATWIQLVTENPYATKRNIALGIGAAGVLAAAYAAYSHFVAQSGPVKGALEYEKWQEDQMNSADVNDLEDSLEHVEELSASRTPNSAALRKARKRLKNKLAQRPPPTSDHFTVVVNMVDAQGRGVAVMPNLTENVTGKPPQKLVNAWQIVVDNLGSQSLDDIDVSFHTPLKGALSYARIKIPDQQGEGVAASMISQLRSGGFIPSDSSEFDLAGGSKVSWVQFEPVVNSYGVIEPTIVVYIQA
jgi:hypothetical protein